MSEKEQVIKDEQDAERVYQRSKKKGKSGEVEQHEEGGSVPPGCSEPNTVPPSVVGTSYDTTRAGAPPKET